MFQDEAGFGRISQLKACWVPKKFRPIAPQHHIRERVYLYGATDAHDGEHFFIIAGHCNTEWTSLFFNELSKAYPDDIILLIMDNATWHKAKSLDIPENIFTTFIPAYTPEMNPIEQVWKTIRTDGGLANRAFRTLNEVVDQLEKAVQALTNQQILSIVSRDWIL